MLALALAVALSSPAHAKKKDACSALKPEQRLSAQQRRAVDAAIRGGVVGVGKGALGVKTTHEHTVEMRLLSDDDLARSWYLHQTCVMKEAGLIDEGTAQALVRQLMGLGPAPGAAAPIDAAPLPLGGKTAIKVSGTPSRAEVWVNGQPRGQLGRGLTVPVSAGTHRVAIKLPRHKTVRSTIKVSPGAEEQVEVAGMSPRLTVAGKLAIWYGSSLATAVGLSALGWWAVESSW